MLELARGVHPDHRLVERDRLRGAADRRPARAAARHHARRAQILGWEPEVDLDEGLRRWVRSLGREPVEALMLARGGSSPARRSSRGSRRAAAQPAGASPLPAGRRSPTRRRRLYGPTRDDGRARTGAARAGRAHEPLLGRQARRRRRRGPRSAADPSTPPTTGRSTTAIVEQLDAARDQGRCSPSTARPRGRTAAQGERRAGARDRPAERSPTRPRCATAARFAGGTARRCRPCATGSPGTSRTTRSSSSRSSSGSAGDWVIASAKSLREDLQRHLQRVHGDARRARAGRLRRHRAARQQRADEPAPSVSPLAFLERGEGGRARTLRRLGAQPVLRDPVAQRRTKPADASGRAAAVDAREHRHPDPAA